MRHIKVRTATADDCGELAELHYQSHTVSYRDFFETDWVVKRERGYYQSYWHDYLTNQPASDRTWVALSNKHVVGMATVMPVQGRHAELNARVHPDLAPGKVAALRHMHVDPDMLGAGIGRALMRYVDAYLITEGYAAAILDTHPENTRARQFFERSGWTFAVRVEDNGIPAVVYHFELHHNS
jgi:GNAT superfamily N-acetyltransferase